MNFRKIMYIVIAIICVVSIGIGVYTEENPKNTSDKNGIMGNESDEYTGKSQEDLRNDFDSIFNNKIDFGNYDTSKITKLDNSKDVVYTVISLKEKKDNYDFDLNLPMVNISGDTAKKFNDITQNVFANKANDIMKGTTDQTIYSVAYTGFVNNDVLSIIIKSTIKEGTNAQRVMVQTYNYDLQDNSEVTIENAINERGSNDDDVKKKIDTQVKEAIKEAENIQVTGYDVYSRDINNDMYKVENTETYFIGPDGALYIVYAYGNKEFTSEMDIIVI